MTSLEVSPRSAARARLKQKHEDEPWKKRYDLAVKQSLGLRLSTPQSSTAGYRRNQFSPNNSILANTANGIEPDESGDDDDHEEMENSMLDPGFEARGNCVESTSSADDSIIRRVEEEIAAARKAASGMNRKLRSPKRSKMPIVLHLPGGVAETISPSVSSSSEDSSKHRALEMIQDEFQDEPNTEELPNERQALSDSALNETQGSNGMRIEVVYSRENTPRNDHPTPPDQLFFTDEEWQVDSGNPVDEQGLPHEQPSEPIEESKPTLSMDHQEQYTTIEQKSNQCSLDAKNTFNFRVVKKQLQDSDHQAAPDDEEMEDRQEGDEPVPNSPKHKNSSPRTTAQNSPSSPASASSKRDSPASSVSRNKDPEGVYSGPKDVITTPTNVINRPSETIFSDNVSTTLSTVSRNSQQKTRELLDNLREQREAMASPRQSGVEASPLIPCSPRSPTITRATRARARVKTASRVRAMPRTDEMAIEESPTEQANDNSIDTQSPLPPPPQRNSSPRVPSSRPKSSPRWNTSSTFVNTVTINTVATSDETPQTPLNEIDEAKRAKRIRFRNPFPVIKNPNSRRDAVVIAQEHSVGIQDTPIRWIKPKQELKQLIVAAMGTSLPRRSNACGALKVLTQQPKNQLALVRTDGFLSALIFAASQSLMDIDRDLAIDARTRAVNCLKNVAAPKDNRVMIMNHPGILECLVKVIKTDGNEGRALATATIALLAKTPVCREGLAQVDGLIDVISKVLQGEGTIPLEESQPLSDNSAVRRKLNDSVSDFSTQSGSHSEEENQENIQEKEKHTFVKEESVPDAESSDEGEEDEEYTDQLPVEISHKKASPQLDSIRNKLEVRHQEFVNQSRANACAILLHMSRQCTISPQLCSSRQVLLSLASVAREVTIAIHSKCLEIICNLSRFPHNNIIITNYDGMIDLLVAASSSAPADNRLNALRTLQNLSADPPSKRYLATTQVLNLMTSCAMRKDAKEKEVAVATIYNITTEPSAVTAITNTKNVVATLVHLAHSPDSSSTIRLLACEALATISLWLQTLAGTGSIPDGVSGVPLPSQKTSGWERWD